LLGRTGGDKIILEGADEILLLKIRSAHEGWFPAYMSAGELPPTN
jgi:hypothetical protein